MRSDVVVCRLGVEDEADAEDEVRCVAFDQEAVRDVLADVASDLADKIKECTPRYFPVLAADPSGFYLAFAPELFAADPSVN